MISITALGTNCVASRHECVRRRYDRVLQVPHIMDAPAQLAPNPLIDKFLERCREEMAAMRRAMEAKDFATIEHAAKRIHAGAITLELPAISDIARVVARSAENRHERIVAGLIDHLGRLVEREGA